MSRIVLFFLAILFSCVNTQAQESYVERLSSKLNSYQYDEISPVVSKDGKTLYFTRVADPSNSKELYFAGRNISYDLNPSEYTSKMRKIFSDLEGKPVQDPNYSKFNQDIWVAESNYGQFDHVYRPSYPLNNALPNSLCSTTPSDDEFIVINQFSSDGGMSPGFSTVRKRGDGNWTFPAPISIPSFYTKSPEVSMSMNRPGDIMIISMNRSDTKGGSDLYVSFKVQEKYWTPPMNLGSNINTAFREVAPFVADDDETIYFASNRLGSLGGMDIYYSKRLDATWLNWTSPIRMNAPINSRADDSMPFFDPITGNLYFCSRRDGTSDIYKTSVAPAKPNNINVAGLVINSKSREITSGKIKIAPVSGAGSSFVVNTENGKFDCSIPRRGVYEVTVEKEDFICHSKIIDMGSLGINEQEMNVELVVDPIEAKSKITINPIYFARSKATILKESGPELKRIAKILKENSHIHICIEGHTDNIGDESALIALSKARAKAVKNYLISKKGIPARRIETEGLGATQPVTTNDSEGSRALNRRVDIRITKVIDINPQ